MTVMHGLLSEMNLEMWWVSQNRSFMKSRGGKVGLSTWGFDLLDWSVKDYRAISLSSPPNFKSKSHNRESDPEHPIYQTCMCLPMDANATLAVVWPIIWYVSCCVAHAGISISLMIPEDITCPWGAYCQRECRIPSLRGMGGIVLFGEQFWPDPLSTWGCIRWLYLFLLSQVLKDFLKSWSSTFVCLACIDIWRKQWKRDPSSQYVAGATCCALYPYKPTVLVPRR